MRLFIILIFASQLSGCAAVVLGGAAVGAVTVSEDQRSLGNQIDDSSRASNIRKALKSVPAFEENAHINVHVYNGAVLLTGQTLNPNLKAEAEKLAKRSANITAIHNQLRIARPTASTTRANDVWLASKIKANLLADDRVNSLRMDVIVEDSEVFLMGIVSGNEATAAVEVSRNIGGVERVYNILEIQPDSTP